MIGRTIGRYRIIDKLGEGGMGSVWKAEDATLGRLVAIKALSARLSEDDESRERFLREAQAASALNHPSITTVHDLLEELGEHYICMEYVDGKTIRDMAESGRVSIRKAVDIILQAAGALDAAHRKGIFHRDVKSANIMVSMEGNVKVMDFGLAQLEQKIQLTRSGTTLGTLSYSPPEQLTGRPYDARSEIWSLGVVLFELLTGSLPFKSTSEGELVFSIINNEPDRLSDLRDDAPEALTHIVARMLEKDPARRFNSCSELIEELKAIRSQMETTAVTSAMPAGEATRPNTGRSRTLKGVGALTFVALAAFVAISLTSRPGETGPSRIAVLPFENLGSAEDESLADGITIEIISRLTGLKDLHVISQNSAFSYKGQATPTRQIGTELDADYILTATVQWQGGSGGAGSVRITPRLIRVKDDSQVWSQTYDEPVDQVFRIQSEIASQIASSLTLTLSPTEQEVLESRPTEVPAAYQAYLRGLELARTGFTEDEIRTLVNLFRLAVREDPGFAQAHAMLAYAGAALHHFGFDQSRENRDAADAAARRAAELGPESPEVHRALGYYHYWLYRDYETALKEFAIAEKALPNDAGRLGVLAGTAFVLRRLGRYQEALDRLERSSHLDPRDSGVRLDIGDSRLAMRDLAGALKSYRQAQEIRPDGLEPYLGESNAMMLLSGDLETARAVTGSIPLEIGADPSKAYNEILLGVYSGDYGGVLETLSRYPEEVLASQFIYYPKGLIRGWVHEAAGEGRLAQIAYLEALPILEREVVRDPDSARLHVALGRTLAGLGRKEEAIREGRRAVELYPRTLDAFAGPFFEEELARIYSRAGEFDAALDLIEALLKSQYSPPLTTHVLRLDPSWAPLRDLPRFKRLVR